MAKNLEDYPIVLGSKEVAEILNVSKPTVYQIMKRKGFPLIDCGSAKKVHRDSFSKWLKAN